MTGHDEPVVDPAARRARAHAEQPPRRPTAHDGVVVVDKPADWTSHDVVARVRRLAGTRKVGHGGTLDPMATGVLVLGIGRATRLLTYVTGADKEYLATIRLGQATTTDDAEGEPIGGSPAAHLEPAAVQAAVGALTGPIEQVPSAVSAIKVDGQRAYARVRAGEDVVLAARAVRIDVFEIRQSRAVGDWLDLDVRVVCSSGTYVRALARDLGERLGVGGHLTALRRSRVAGFGLDGAATLDELAAAAQGADDGRLPVLSPGRAAAAVLPVRAVDEQEAAQLSFGRSLAARGDEQGPVAAITASGTLVAVLVAQAGRARPVLVMTPANEPGPRSS